MDRAPGVVGCPVHFFVMRAAVPFYDPLQARRMSYAKSDRISQTSQPCGRVSAVRMEPLLLRFRLCLSYNNAYGSTSGRLPGRSETDLERKNSHERQAFMDFPLHPHSLHGMWAIGPAGNGTLSNTHRNTDAPRPGPDCLSRPSQSHLYPDTSVPNPHIRGPH